MNASQLTDPDRKTRSRPKESDFDPFGGCLDAQYAWKNFGGLSVAEAYTKFCERPELYQEDFMFMGGTAFSYYFPVIECYIRESNADAGNEHEVDAMWILAHCIKQQFENLDTLTTEPLRTNVLDLVSYVRQNLTQYCAEPTEQQRIDSAWAELQARLTSAEQAG